MPGTLLTPETGSPTSSRRTGGTMGVYRLTIPEAVQESLNPNARNGSSSSKSQRQQFLSEYRSASAHPSPRPSRFLEVPFLTPSRTWLEPPDIGHFSLLDDNNSTSSVFTNSSSSTRTSHTVTSDESDYSLRLDSSITTNIDDAFFPQAPKRLSTACCADMDFRREQRKRLDPTCNPSVAGRDPSLATLSFRRELAMEDDHVEESLALWEDDAITHFDHQPRRPVVDSQPAPHSWHAGDSAASSGSSRNKTKKKKSSSSSNTTFFNGLFSGLHISATRRYRKSAS